MRTVVLVLFLVLTAEGCALEFAVDHYRKERDKENYMRRACRDSPPFRAREKALCAELLGEQPPAAAPAEAK